MRTRLVLMLAAALAVSLTGVSTASAATEFGDNCTANETTNATKTATLFALTAAGDPLPLTAPTSGVITKWKIDQATTTSGLPQTLRVIRQTGPETVQVIGESPQTVMSGSNSFDTRIPVQTGDRLGLSAVGLLLFCLIPGPENFVGVFEGAPTGSSATFEQIPAEARVPVAAVIEPDADGDGYGDETQDKCPQSATTQAPCPVVTLSTVGAVKKTLASISVTSSSQASVTVAGAVRLGKGKTATLNGGTQIVAPGTLAKFVLLFPQKLQAALKALPRKRFLTLTVTASAPNVVGAPSTSTLKLHLKGQAKPKKHNGKKARS